MRPLWLRSRLRRLEARVPPPVDERKRLVQAALSGLSVPELEALEAALVAMEAGRLLTAHEAAALARYHSPALARRTSSAHSSTICG